MNAFISHKILTQNQYIKLESKKITLHLLLLLHRQRRCRIAIGIGFA